MGRAHFSLTSFVCGLSSAVLAAALVTGVAGCNTEKGSPVRIEISHVVGSAPLQLGGSVYATAGGDSFSVSRLRYYLSNFRLKRKDGSWFVPAADPKSSQGYYLIDEADGASKAFEIVGVPAGEYVGIEFLVGIDTARNTAGVQSGTLDPAHGLFWTWKTGYIFFQLEGSSPQSKLERQGLSFHIGGSDEPSLARTVFLPLAPKPARVESRLLPIIHLHADLAGVFHGVHEISLAETSTAMDSPSGRPFADNIAGIFRVDHLHHEPRKGAGSP